MARREQEVSVPRPIYVYAQDVENDLPNLVCTVCHDVIRRQASCPGCKKSFCQECISRWFTAQKSKDQRCTCPNCRKRLKHSDLKHDAQLQRELDALPVYCPHKAAGCDARPARGALQAHLDNDCREEEAECSFCTFREARGRLHMLHSPVCMYRLVPCTAGCGQELSVCDMTAHLTTECPAAPCSCKLCGAVVRRDESVAHNLTACPSRSHCRYMPFGCSMVGPVQEVAAHAETCPFRQAADVFQAALEPEELGVQTASATAVGRPAAVAGGADDHAALMDDWVYPDEDAPARLFASLGGGQDRAGSVISSSGAVAAGDGMLESPSSDTGVEVLPAVLGSPPAVAPTAAPPLEATGDPAAPPHEGTGGPAAPEQMARQRKKLRYKLLKLAATPGNARLYERVRLSLALRTATDEDMDLLQRLDSSFQLLLTEGDDGDAAEPMLHDGTDDDDSSADAATTAAREDFYEAVAQLEGRRLERQVRPANPATVAAGTAASRAAEKAVLADFRAFAPRSDLDVLYECMLRGYYVTGPDGATYHPAAARVYKALLQAVAEQSAPLHQLPPLDDRLVRLPGWDGYAGFWVPSVLRVLRVAAPGCWLDAAALSALNDMVTRLGSMVMTHIAEVSYNHEDAFVDFSAEVAEQAIKTVFPLELAEEVQRRAAGVLEGFEDAACGDLDRETWTTLAAKCKINMEIGKIGILVNQYAPVMSDEEDARDEEDDGEEYSDGSDGSDDGGGSDEEQGSDVSLNEWTSANGDGAEAMEASYADGGDGTASETSWVEEGDGGGEASEDLGDNGYDDGDDDESDEEPDVNSEDMHGDELEPASSEEMEQDGDTRGVLWLATAFEVVLARLLERAKAYASANGGDNSCIVIGARHVQLAALSSGSLNRLLMNSFQLCIPHAGVLPNVHLELLPRDPVAKALHALSKVRDTPCARHFPLDGTVYCNSVTPDSGPCSFWAGNQCASCRTLEWARQPDAASGASGQSPSAPEQQPQEQPQQQSPRQPEQQPRWQPPQQVSDPPRKQWLDSLRAEGPADETQQNGTTLAQEPDQQAGPSTQPQHTTALRTIDEGVAFLQLPEVVAELHVIAREHAAELQGPFIDVALKASSSYCSAPVPDAAAAAGAAAVGVDMSEVQRLLCLVSYTVRLYRHLHPWLLRHPDASSQPAWLRYIWPRLQHVSDVAALKQIQLEQRSTDPAIPAAVFTSIVDGLVARLAPELHLSPAARAALQTAAEGFMVEQLQLGNSLAVHAGRQEVQPRDLRLGLRATGHLDLLLQPGQSVMDQLRTEFTYSLA